MKDRLVYSGTLLLTTLLLQKTLAAPFKEPSSPNRASVLCVLPQPTDEPSGTAMTSSRHTNQQAQTQTLQNHANDKHASSQDNDDANNTAKLVAGKSEDTAKKEIPPSAKKLVAGYQSKDDTTEKSGSVSKSGTSSNEPSDSSQATKSQRTATAKSSSLDDQTISAQLLDAKSPAVAAFVGSPQKRVRKISPSTGSSASKFKPSEASSTGRSNYEVPGAVLIHSGNNSVQAELFGEKFDMSAWMERTERNDQGNVWTEMDNLRGREAMSAGEIQDTLQKAVPGKDYPNYSSIPTTSFKCENVHQAGFYADPEARCQVIRRCDVNAMKWSYLCPNGTLFSQITLTCQWFFDVDCSKAVQYYDYSNSRLYHSDWVLLDTPPDNQA